jgi:hypothetical protein
LGIFFSREKKHTFFSQLGSYARGERASSRCALSLSSRLVVLLLLFHEKGREKMADDHDALEAAMEGYKEAQLKAAAKRKIEVWGKKNELLCREVDRMTSRVDALDGHPEKQAMTKKLDALSEKLAQSEAALEEARERVYGVKPMTKSATKT